MKIQLTLAFAVVLLLGTASGQGKPIRVAEIDFFGYQGIDLNQIRPAIPVRVGDEFSPTAKDEVKSRIMQAVQKVTGSPPTDVATICCDTEGRSIIYVGLPGKSSEKITYNPATSGTVRLPSPAIKLYQAEGKAVRHAVESGNSGEDDSKGYALANDPALRSIELQMRGFAMHNETLLRSVLQSSSSAKDREAAAEIIGYANESQQQIEALVHATYDPDDDVRNNAVRALGVLASSGARIADQIPASGFVAMLNSGVWTDRNKASFLVETLTQSRNPRLLAELRVRALASLIEMARWDNGHAVPARIILGRIAGIDEAKLQNLAWTDADAIISAASK